MNKEVKKSTVESKYESIHASCQGDDDVNLFKSCMEDSDVFKSQIPIQECENGSPANDDFEEEINAIIRNSICAPLAEAEKILERTEGPAMPSTFSLYRALAYKKFKILCMIKAK